MTMTGLHPRRACAAGPAGRPRRTRIGPREVALGLASAATLYATFKVGDVFARRFVPGGDAEIRDIYTLRTIRPKEEIAHQARDRHRPRRGTVLARPRPGGS